MVGTIKEARWALISMTWLILGANGQLGRALSKVLVEREISFNSWDAIELDITSEVTCLNRISDLRPTVIINSAAWTDVDGAELNPIGAHRVNAIGPLNIARSAKSIGAVLVQISTDYVFSGDRYEPWGEDDIKLPVSEYGRAKAEGEDAVSLEYQDRTYIIRTAWLYSEWGKNFAKTMTRLALFGSGEVMVVDDQIGQPTFAIDLANQIVEMIVKKMPYGIYHGTNSGQGSWFDFAQEIFELSGQSTARLVPVSSNQFMRLAKRPSFSVLGHAKWKSSSSPVAEMRNWRLALKQAMPSIIEAIRLEG